VERTGHERIAVSTASPGPPFTTTLGSTRMDDAEIYRRRLVRTHLVPDVVFAFHHREEIGPRMLARIA